MIGRGIPINQSKAPLPKPIVSSSGKLHRDVNSFLQTRFHPCISAATTAAVLFNPAIALTCRRTRSAASAGMTTAPTENRNELTVARAPVDAVEGKVSH
jgi:hypothetical protein